MRTMSSKKGFPAHCFSMFFVVVSIMKHQFLKPLTPEMQFVREMAGFHGQVATKKMQRIHFRTNHSARVTGQRRVFFRVSGRVVTMVEASRFSWRVYVPSWLTNAERDSSKDARS